MHKPYGFKKTHVLARNHSIIHWAPCPCCFHIPQLNGTEYQPTMQLFSRALLYHFQIWIWSPKHWQADGLREGSLSSKNIKKPGCWMHLMIFLFVFFVEAGGVLGTSFEDHPEWLHCLYHVFINAPVDFELDRQNQPKIIPRNMPRSVISCCRASHVDTPQTAAFAHGVWAAPAERRRGREVGGPGNKTSILTHEIYDICRLRYQTGYDV